MTESEKKLRRKIKRLERELDIMTQTFNTFILTVGIAIAVSYSLKRTL